ncbi:MAG: folylpolyglutamate synthase/dihydrofolate synthase family protein [Gemmatimonadota bacterium]
MGPVSYEALVAELFPRLTGGVQWGLERTRRLLSAVGDPHRSFRVLHVGGTNGKGSVAAHLDSVLRRAGHRVGLYSSPHLCSFRERLRIGGRPIEERALLESAGRLWPMILHEQASFFEATTAISFLAMAAAGVETAVVEVGLGGRLDATNVVDPDVVVLTNVTMDHVQLLGPTLDRVASEKAGIMKPGVPIVTAEPDPAILQVFRAAADAAGSSLRRTRLVLPGETDAPVPAGDAQVAEVAVSRRGTVFRLTGTSWGDLRLTTPLIGGHQAMNAALAVHALDAMWGARGPDAARPSLDDVRLGIADVHWPGRFQIEQIAGVTWLFDVAHNVAGIRSLVTALDAVDLPSPLIALVGVLGDKDWRSILGPLHAAADRVILTSPPSAPAERSWNPAAALSASGLERGAVVDSFAGALEAAHAAALPRRGTVLVTGSFHTVGDAMSALGLCRHGSDAQVAPPAFMR